MKGVGTKLRCGVACVRNEIERVRERKTRFAVALVLAGLCLLALAYNGALEEFRQILRAGSAMFSASGIGAAVKANLP
ncbi:MAG: hypothetical protein GX224_02315 [Thermoplasmatales archaeon]|nr:hypothetical protein [Thermoplasmatales archaeon]